MPRAPFTDLSKRLLVVTKPLSILSLYPDIKMTFNASHHLQPKAERGTSGAFGCPSVCDCYVTFMIPLH